jgi:hypothetical protein
MTQPMEVVRQREYQPVRATSSALFGSVSQWKIRERSVAIFVRPHGAILVFSRAVRRLLASGRA